MRSDSCHLFVYLASLTGKRRTELWEEKHEKKNDRKTGKVLGRKAKVDGKRTWDDYKDKTTTSGNYYLLID